MFKAKCFCLSVYIFITNFNSGKINPYNDIENFLLASGIYKVIDNAKFIIYRLFKGLGVSPCSKLSVIVLA